MITRYENFSRYSKLLSDLFNVKFETGNFGGHHGKGYKYRYRFFCAI